MSDTIKAQNYLPLVAVILVVTFHAIHFSLITVRPELEPYWHTISEWSLGPMGWLGRIGWVCAGVAYLALAYALHPTIRGRAARLGQAVLLLCGAALIGVGIFVSDPMDGTPGPLTPTGILHVVCGMTQLMGLPLGALVLGPALKKSFGRGFLAISILPLAALIAFFIHVGLYVIPHGENAHGPEIPIGWPPRFLFLTYAVWIIAAAIGQIRHNKYS